MSNINLILSNAIAAARGDKAAQAIGIAEGIGKAFGQYAQHGQKTPFQYGLDACKAWKGELGNAVEGIVLAFYAEARAMHDNKVKPSAADLEAVAARIAADVEGAYKAEASRAEAKKAEGKVKAEARKATAEAEAKAAEADKAAQVGEGEAEARKVIAAHADTIADLEAANVRLADELKAARLEVLTLQAELATARAELEATQAVAVAKVSRKARAVAVA
jgi:hypothetical protein